MMHRLKIVWKDPVWSKIIAAIIIGVGTIVWATIKSIISDTKFQTTFYDLVTLKIELWIIALFIVIIIVGLQILTLKNKKGFNYDEETLKLDRDLFNKIRNELLPQNNTIYFLRHNNFAGFSFDLEKLNDIYEIESENVNSDFEFLNPELERLKTGLINHIAHFTYIIGYETFPTKTGRQAVPEEWEIEQPERFNRVVDDLHKTKHEICDKYDELIRSGRRILKI